MISAIPRSWSGVRSPRVIFTSTTLKPAWRCGRTFASRKRSNSERSPFGLAGATGGPGAFASSSIPYFRWSIEKSRSATQSPSSSSSTISRKASMPILSISTLIRARARLTRSHSWRSKMRKTASVIFR